MLTERTRRANWFGDFQRELKDSYNKEVELKVKLVNFPYQLTFPTKTNFLTYLPYSN